MIDSSKLGGAAQTVLAQYPVRKTPAQKQAFRAWLVPFLQAAGWDVQVESSGRLLKTDNVVAGDIKTAKLVLTAHYDTPARMPFPNFIAPRNLVITLLYQLLLVAVFFGVSYAASFVVHRLGGSTALALLLDVLMVGILLWLMLAGPANPSNANDNTSGVLTLLETACTLPAEARKNVALVFFDNEEKGLIGSGVFSKRYGVLPNALLLNFDCVGNGDTFLFVQPRVCRRDKQLAQRLRDAFPDAGAKHMLLERSPLTLYPSDQFYFRRGIGVAALRRAPLIGYYLPRLHTARDVVLQQENLLFLRDGCARLAQQLAAGENAAGAKAPAPAL